ncbi:MAG: aldo/keto reductase, partial [Halobacteriales archaeon]|nr:aldo/keto reductase [Halobacteriales archaeon]
MSTRSLGTDGFGTWDIRGDPCTDAVESALEAGYRHIDTARMYKNESAVGAGIDRSDVDRESIYLATKVWDDSLAYEAVLHSAEESRQDLGVSTLDLLYIHWPRDTYVPEETLPAFDDLIDRGVIRDVGLSNFTPALLDEARDVLEAPIRAHQVEMHPLLPQTELLAYA